MDEARLETEEVRIYAAAYELAKRYALRHVAASQASEVAHDVAVAIVRWSLAPDSTFEPGRSLTGFIHRAVINRLRDGHRRNSARTAAEQGHAIEMQQNTPTWVDPADALEAGELASLMRAAIADMPPAMRTIFLLVREHDRTYKEVAAELNLAVGTVHTQISRAHALLRVAIERYRGDDAITRPRNHNLRTSA